MISYLYQRGESVTLALEVAAGDPGLVSGVSAALKPIPAGSGTIDPAAPVAARFTVQFRAAAGDKPAMWLLSLDSATTAGLTAGLYSADARLIAGGGVIVTEQVQLRFRNSVSGL